MKKPTYEQTVFGTLTVLAVLLFIVFLLTGCSQTTRTVETKTKDTTEDTSISGSIGVPVSTEAGTITVPVPFHVDFHRVVGEEEHRDGNREAKINVPEIGAAISAALGQFAPGLSSLIPKPPSGGLNGLDITALSTTGLALAGMLQRHLATRKLAAQVKAHEDDADEAWDTVKTIAKAKAPPADKAT